MADPDAHPDNKAPRVLSKRVQVLVACCVALIAAVIFGGSRLFDQLRSENSTPEVAPPPAPGSFRPTQAQWATLKVSPVQLMPFQSEQRTDGNIAYNDDATTPVFSPYSGRVTRLIAKLGDVVRQGEPLFAIEATEFVQVQNDLIAAVS